MGVSPLTEDRSLVASLHGLRGMAVIYVLLSHIGNAGWMLGPFPHNAIGKVGVWIFFGLSAYLLTTKLRDQLSRSARGEALVRYFIHRVFRIYPLYLAVIVLNLAVGEFDLGMAFRHMVLMEGRHELWAIPTEFQFYFIIPIIALLDRKPAFCFISTLLIAGLAYGLYKSESVFSNGLFFLPKAAPFLLASYLSIARPWWTKSAFSGWMSLCLLLVCTVMYRHMYASAQPGWLNPSGWVTPWLSLAIGAAVAGLISSILERGFLASFFSSKFLVWIGEISFSIYLLHGAVIKLVDGLDLGPHLSGWITVVASVAVGSISYLLIEKPGMKLGRRLSAETLMPARAI